MADFHIWATYLIIAATVVGYASERYQLELVAFASLACLLLLFTLAPMAGPQGVEIDAQALLAGFANPALITVIALLIVGQGLFATDAMDAPARWLARLGGASGSRTIAVTLLAAATLSAVLNNTPVVVIFIPVLTVLAAQRNFSLTKVLMPLSFLSILGGMTTLIGSSTNLLVAGVAQNHGTELGFFDITVPGLALAAAGALYVLFVMPAILSKGDGETAERARISGTQFIGDIRVTAGHPFEGLKSRAGMFPGLKDMTPRLVMQRGEIVLPPYEDVELGPGDEIVVSGTRGAFLAALARGSASTSATEATENGQETSRPGPDYHIAEAVIAPGSRHAGRLVRNSGIESAHGVTIIGIQRKSRMGRQRMADIRLEPGDTILIGGTDREYKALRGDHDLLLLEWSAEPVPQRRLASMAALIFAGIVAAAASGMVPIVVAAVIGAFLMVATGCLTFVQASRSFDRQVFMLVGASLAAATALEATGGARLIASSAAAALDGAPAWVTLSGLFLVIALLTNILSNNATAVLFAPIAIGLADTLGVAREPFLVCVIFAANTSFATPIGYQTNLLVMGPGRYSFADFVKAGAPLVVIIWLTFTAIAPWYYAL